MTVTATYSPPTGSSTSLGWTCQQVGRVLDTHIRGGIAADTHGSTVYEVGNGSAEVTP